MEILFLSSLFKFGKKMKIEILRIHFFNFLLPLLLRWRPCARRDPNQPCLQRKQASRDRRISISRSSIAQRHLRSISIWFFFENWKMNALNFNFLFLKTWKKKSKKSSFSFLQKNEFWKMGCKIVFNFQQKWKMKTAKFSFLIFKL